MSTVPFRCPYCGTTELHPAGRKLPEMCGQCRFDSAGRKKPVQAGFVRPGPPPLPVSPPFVLPAGESTASQIRRMERKHRNLKIVTWAGLLAVAGVTVWKLEPVWQRYRQAPQNGLIAAAIPDPDQLLLTDYLKETLDDPNFEFVRADRVDGDVIRRAWTAELEDIVRRWELTVKKHPDADFMGMPAKSLDADMQKLRSAVQELRQFDGRRFIRLKYRERNHFGAMELRDVVFTLEGSRVAAAVPMGRPFQGIGGLLVDLDPRLYFIQIEASDGGRLISKDKAIDKLAERGFRWEPRP